MKICAYCGKELPDFALFCADCGNRVEDVPAVQPPVEDVPVEDFSAQMPIEDVPVQAPKKKRWVRILVAIVSAVAVLFFTFDFIFNWFGLFSPMARVSRATMRTLQADSWTLSASVKTKTSNKYSEQSGTARIVVDEKAEAVHRYTTSSQYTESDGSNSRSEKISATSNGKDYSYTTVGGIVTDGSIEEVDDARFFDWREEMDDDVDWEDVIEDAKLDDYIRADEMDRFVRVLARKYFGNRRWLKKNVGYTKDGNTYTFRPDTETFMEALVDIVDDSKAFKRKAKSDVEDGVEKLLKQLEEHGIEIDTEFSFTVKGRYLSNLHLELAVTVEDEVIEVEMDFDISDVNRTKISKSEVRSVKSTVNEYLEAEGITYDECDECSDFGEMYDYGGQDLCYDCYFDRKYD